MRNTFISILKEVCENNGQKVIDFGIEYFDIDQGSLPTNLYTPIQIIGYFWDKFIRKNDLNKWKKFLDNILEVKPDLTFELVESLRGIIKNSALNTAKTSNIPTYILLNRDKQIEKIKNLVKDNRFLIFFTIGEIESCPEIFLKRVKYELKEILKNPLSNNEPIINNIELKDIEIEVISIEKNAILLELRKSFNNEKINKYLNETENIKSFIDRVKETEIFNQNLLFSQDVYVDKIDIDSFDKVYEFVENFWNLNEVDFENGIYVVMNFIVNDCKCHCIDNYKLKKNYTHFLPVFEDIQQKDIRKYFRDIEQIDKYNFPDNQCRWTFKHIMNNIDNLRCE